MTFLYWLNTQWVIAGGAKIETISTVFKHSHNLTDSQKNHLVMVYKYEAGVL